MKDQNQQKRASRISEFDNRGSYQQNSQQKQKISTEIENNKNDDINNYSNNFITEIPIESYRQTNEIKEKQQTNQKKQSQQQRDSQSQNQYENIQNSQQNDKIQLQQRQQQKNIQQTSPNVSRNESIEAIEQGNKRRQKLIQNNLSILSNKQSQDVQKIDDTIKMFRIEIIETQRDIKERAKIEREELQEYHTQMHKKISDLMKMKQSIIQNQKQIQINKIKQQSKRNKRSSSETNLKSRDSFIPISLLKGHANNKNDGKQQNKIPQSHKCSIDQNIQSNHKDEEGYQSQFSSEQKNKISNEVSLEHISKNQFNINSRPLIHNLEEKNQSETILPEIQQRQDIIKQNYRQRMDPLKLFREHEKKYDEIKEIKEKQRNSKIQNQIKEMRQHSQEKFTKSSSYVKILNEKMQQKEQQQIKEQMQKIILERQKIFKSNIQNNQKVKRSYSTSEVINTLQNNKNAPINQIVKENHQREEIIQKNMETQNSQIDSVKKEFHSEQKKSVTEQSSSEKISSLQDLQQTNQSQKLKIQKRKIYHSKLKEDNSNIIPQILKSNEVQTKKINSDQNLESLQNAIDIKNNDQNQTNLDQITQIQLNTETSTVKKQLNNKNQNQTQTQQKVINDLTQFVEKRNKTQQSKQENNIQQKQEINQLHASHQRKKSDFSLPRIKNNNSYNFSQNQQNNSEIQQNRQQKSKDKKQNISKNQHLEDSNNIKFSKNNDSKRKDSIQDFGDIQLQNENDKSLQKLRKIEKCFQKILQNVDEKMALSDQKQTENKQSVNLEINKINPVSNEQDNSQINNLDKQNNENLIFQNVDMKSKGQEMYIHNDKKNEHKQVTQDKQTIIQQPLQQNIKADKEQIPEDLIIHKKEDNRQDNYEQTPQTNLLISQEDKALNNKQIQPEQLTKHLDESKDANLINDKNSNNSLDRKQNQNIEQNQRQISEIQSQRNIEETNKEEQRVKNEENKSKEKSSIKNVKERQKLRQQIDDWRKIDKNEMINNQQSILKLSEKINQLDAKLQQIRNTSRINKRNQSEVDSQNIHDHTLILNSTDIHILQQSN